MNKLRAQGMSGYALVLLLLVIGIAACWVVLKNPPLTGQTEVVAPISTRPVEQIKMPDGNYLYIVTDPTNGNICYVAVESISCLPVHGGM